MTVLEYIATHADELAGLSSREDLFKAISQGVNAPIDEYQHSIKEMNFLYQVLKGIFADGKLEEARHLYETISKVVEAKTPR